MKKITIVIFTVLAAISTGFSQANVVQTIPAVANGNTTARGPNGTTGHTVMRAMYNVPAADMAPLASSTVISSFGFQLNSGGAAASSGTLTVYLQNSSNSTYTNGTTWSTSGFTQAYTGTYNIPIGATAANVDFTFPSNFTYAGGALNVAYEYTATVTNATAANYAAFTASPTILGATGGAGTISAPVLGTTSFRPLFRFGVPNTYTNEIIVQAVNAPGKYPTTFASPETITADIMNGSIVTVTNIAVGLSVSGVNTFTNVQFIGSLAPGGVTTVTFASFPTTVQGINTVSVGVAPDQNSINNVITSTQSITCDVWAYNPPTGTYNAGVGFNTGSGIISSKFSTPVASTCTSVRLAISTDAATTGNPIYGVLMNATGSVIATTNTVTILASMLGTFQNFVYTTPQALTASVAYYAGLAQTANTTGYFPVGSQTTAVAPTDYYTSALNPTTTPSFLATNLGYFGIEPVFTSTCSSVGVTLHELNADAKISVYPNPTINGKTNIAGLEGTNTITVYNMLGQSVLTLTSEKEEVSIDLLNQPMGNYLIKITDSNKALRTVKVINQ